MQWGKEYATGATKMKNIRTHENVMVILLKKEMANFFTSLMTIIKRHKQIFYINTQLNSCILYYICVCIYI